MPRKPAPAFLDNVVDWRRVLTGVLLAAVLGLVVMFGKSVLWEHHAIALRQDVDKIEARLRAVELEQAAARARRDR